MATSRSGTLLACVLALASGAAWSREAASPAACQAAATQPAVLQAREDLNEHADDVRARVKLADAWSDAGCFSDSLRVLQAGAALNPHDAELQERVRVAKSLIAEQSYFDTMDQEAKDARVARAEFRCTKLAELASCDEALALKPNDFVLLVGEGDTLVQLKRPGEAIGAYRNALRVTPNQETVVAKVAAAETQRRSLLDVCETQSGETARRACEAAWLPGAPDEFRVFTRRGVLLQTENRPAAALDAYMAAARLRPTDQGVALAVVGLSQSTGRQDPVTLTAEGTALNTLGRSSEAISPLRQALKYAPDLAAAKTQLHIAEESATSPKVAARSGETVRPRPATPRVPVSANPAPVTAMQNEEAQVPKYSNDAPLTRSN